MFRKIKKNISEVDQRVTNISNANENTRAELQKDMKDVSCENDLVLKKINILDEKVNKAVSGLEILVDKKLAEFERQIADKYFDTLEKIFRCNKEISLIQTLSNQVGEKDLAQLKSALLQPVLEAKWDAKKKDNANKIESGGMVIVKRMEELHNEIIVKERGGQDVSKLKEQMKSFEWIKKEILHEK